jgi:phospholipid/cholesterol/gamma-HCH transport system substrate-binding protein
MKQNIETIVGTGVIIFCILLVLAVYNKGLFTTKPSFYTLNASFERADGINVGNDINISGVKVGEVISKVIDENTYNAVLKITVDKKLRLSIDTSAEITSSSLFGDKYISLVPGAETELLKDGDTIEFTQSSINIEGLITKFFFGVDNAKNDGNVESATP